MPMGMYHAIRKNFVDLTIDFMILLLMNISSHRTVLIPSSTLSISVSIHVHVNDL